MTWTRIINTKTFALLSYGETMKRMNFLLLSVLRYTRLDLKQPSCLQKFKQNHIERLQRNLLHLLVLVDALLKPAAVFTHSDRLVAQLVNN